jgi:hypothetical protein
MCIAVLAAFGQNSPVAPYAHFLLAMSVGRRQTRSYQF